MSYPFPPTITITPRAPPLRNDLTETFKIIHIISNYGRHFSIFLVELVIYCQDRFQKLYQPTNWIFWLIESSIFGRNCLIISTTMIVYKNHNPGPSLSGSYSTAESRRGVSSLFCREAFFCPRRWDSHIQDTYLGSLTSLQRCGCCILLPRATGPSSAEMQPVYSTAPTDWVIVGGVSYPSAEKHSAALTDGTVISRILIWGVLPLCKDAVAVFSCLGRLGPLLQRCNRCILQPQLIGSLLVGCLTLLQRCSRCILQPQPTRPLLGEYSTPPADFAV